MPGQPPSKPPNTFGPECILSRVNVFQMVSIMPQTKNKDNLLNRKYLIKPSKPLAKTRASITWHPE